jgi:tetratricopeptide (TPR) repeat protein
MLAFLIVTVLSVLLAGSELGMRYRDDPLSAVRSPPGLLYLALNAMAAIAAMALINVFDWRFGLPPNASPTQLQVTRILVAGLGSAALFRTSLFIVRQGDHNIGIGPAGVLDALLSLTEREVDRRRAVARLHDDVLEGLSFEQHAKDLTALCTTALQNLNYESAQRLGEQLASLRADKNLSDWAKLTQYGLELRNLVGEKALIAAAKLIREREPKRDPQQSQAPKDSPLAAPTSKRAVIGRPEPIPRWLQDKAHSPGSPFRLSLSESRTVRLPERSEWIAPLRELTQVLWRLNGNIDAYFARAWYLESAARQLLSSEFSDELFAAAHDDYQEVLKEFPRQPEVRLALARIRSPRLEWILLKHIRNDRTASPASLAAVEYEFGRQAYWQDHWQDAIGCFDEAIRHQRKVNITQRLPDIYIARACCCIRLGHLDEAASTLDLVSESVEEQWTDAVRLTRLAAPLLRLPASVDATVEPKIVRSRRALSLTEANSLARDDDDEIGELRSALVYAAQQLVPSLRSEQQLDPPFLAAALGKYVKPRTNQRPLRLAEIQPGPSGVQQDEVLPTYATVDTSNETGIP